SQPSRASRMPLPQLSSDRQSALQPSPLTVLPSSQASPASMTPLPQPVGRQDPAKQAASSAPAISQRSPSLLPLQALTCSGRTQRSPDGEHTRSAGQRRLPLQGLMPERRQP